MAKRSDSREPGKTASVHASKTVSEPSGSTGAGKTASVEVTGTVTESSDSVRGAGVRVMHYRPKKKRKKGKKRYSDNSEGMQRMMTGASRASWRVSRAVADGMKAFYDRSEQSAKRRRDGAMVDVVENAADSMENFARVAGKAPRDMVRGMGSKYVRQQVRSAMRGSFFR